MVSDVGIPAHIARLRAFVGHDLLIFPSVALVLIDPPGRLLLVQHAGHHDGWGLVGGAVEIGESPAEAAIREAWEEIGVEVRLRRLLDAFGGPEFEVTYPSGDRTAYVTVVYEAEVVAGVPVADRDELSEVAWFTAAQIVGLPLNRNTRAVLAATGHL